MKNRKYIKSLQSLCSNYKADIVDGPFGSNLKRCDYRTEGIPVLKIQNIKRFQIELKKMDYVNSDKYNELKRHSYSNGDIVMTKLGNPLGASAIVNEMDDGLIVADLVRIRANKIKFVEKAFNEKDSKSILRYGDVLTNIVGASIGRTAIFDCNESANINQAVCILRCKKTVLNNQYLCFLLNSPFLVTYLHDNEINNARANLSLTFFRELEIPIPPLNKQKGIVFKIDQLQAETKHLEKIYQQKIADLEELKKSILQKAFEGEL